MDLLLMWLLSLSPQASELTLESMAVILYRYSLNDSDRALLN